MLPDILLLITEVVDLRTLQVLMQLNKASHALLKRYEHAIVKARCDAYRQASPYPEMCPPHGRAIAKGFYIDVHSLPPHGEHSRMTWTIAACSFPLLQELERRVRRREGLFLPGRPLSRALLADVYPEVLRLIGPDSSKLLHGLHRAWYDH